MQHRGSGDRRRTSPCNPDGPAQDCAAPLSSNRFAADHGGAQAFGYDLWRSRQLVQALFPLPSNQVDRERFIHARVMLTIATLMAITDGSLQVLVRLTDA